MMKKIICLILSLVAVFALFACGEEEANNDTCTAHVDEDADWYCDNCGVEICDHYDENKDLYCDYCEQALECVDHEDKEPDGYCDICEAEVEVTVCVDKDNNGYCDFHGEKLECAEHKDVDTNGSCDVCGAKVDLGKGADFFAAVKNSNPTTITTATTLDADGETLTGRYSTMLTNDGFVFDYSYQKFSEIGPDAGDDRIAVVEGKVYYKNGQYSTDGITWESKAPSVEFLNMSFNLTENTLGGKYTLSADGKTLTATLDSSEVLKVFGMNIDADEIDVEIKLQGQYLGNVKITYETRVGTKVINTSYVYAPIAE
jgi:hypothetical protein